MNYRKQGVVLTSILGSVLLLTIVTYLALDQDRTNAVSTGTEIEKQEGTIQTASLSLINQRLRFVANHGQAGPDALFHVEGAGHSVFFFPDRVTLHRRGPDQRDNDVTVLFEGANIAPQVKGVEKLRGVEHFYRGADPENWQTNVPTFGTVRYTELYSGIDMAYIGAEGVLESEFYVSPGADVQQIRLNYQNVRSTTIRGDGALVLETELGDLVEKAPYSFQEIDGVNVEIDSRYVLLEDNSVGFELGVYDRNYEVVIDPELIFLVTYGAAFSIGFTSAEEVAIDSDGDVILAGFSNLNFPATDTIGASNDASISGLLMKLDGTSGEVLYSALFGGTGIDRFNGMALDQAGTMYLTGETESDDFPVLNAEQATRSGAADAFLVILTPDMVLSYSSYLGGTDFDSGRGITMDGAGNVFVGGITLAADFPVTAGAFQETFQGGGSDYFVTKFNALGAVSFSTYLGGTDSDFVCDVVVNALGEVAITGNTISTDFPTANAYQNAYGGGASFETDITISRLNATGSGLIYSTYLGGSRNDKCQGIALGPNDDVFVSGNTTSDNFPVIGGTSIPEAGIKDGFLISLDNTGQPVFSVRSNMAGDDDFVEVTVDESNTASVVSQYADSLTIFEKEEGDSLSSVFTFGGLGLRIHTAYAAGGFLAVAGEDLGPNGIAAQKNSSGDLFSAMMSLGRVEIFCRYDSRVPGKLTITIKEGNVAPIRIGAADDPDLTINVRIGKDENGKMTVNGITKNGDFDDFRQIFVGGSEGDDDIDLTGLSHDAFPTIANLSVSVWGNDGNDKLKGIDDRDNRLLSGGSGDDEVIGGDKNDGLVGGDLRGPVGNDRLDGRGGNDSYEHENDPLGKSSFREGAALLDSSDVLVVVDSAGIDTLNFVGRVSGITLNLDVIDAEQTLDAQGSLITLSGNFEVVRGTGFDDEITVAPLAGVDRHVDGSAGNDVLNYASESAAEDDGSTITTTGYGDVTYVNIETVILSIATAIDEDDGTLPTSFSLSQNYPNPFNPTTSIQYSLPDAGVVSLRVYNTLGQRISMLTDAHQQPGTYTVAFDAGKLPSGIYFYELRAGDFVSTKKMLLLK